MQHHTTGDIFEYQPLYFTHKNALSPPDSWAKRHHRKPVSAARDHYRAFTHLAQLPPSWTCQ
jgi:hypothetical protein